ncbi:MAG: acyl-[ACP]--phospholipid O-acyltransferase [Alphaproteobacteria bacterium]|nr:acyl-[ACP]--phospholipid O-acyltransferase [Alphaproteobacteria bacterium]
MNKILSILKQRAFLSVFITQFLGAFNDNLFRAAMSGFVTYKIYTITEGNKQIIVTMAVGLFMLPFFLFSAIAGEMADKFRKDVIFKITKFIEVVIASCAIVGFYLHNPYILLFVLMLMGMQSAFFGPAKYSVLPDILKKDELIAGNALFEAGTYLAILQGIIIGGVIMSGESSGLLATAIWIMSVALIGFTVSLFIPKVEAVDPESKIQLNFLKSTWENMKFATIKRDIFLCILGISWFWLIGASLISQIPSYAGQVLNADGNVYTWLLTLFSCGVGVGAIACQALLKGEITPKFVPISAILMTLFMADLALASLGMNPDHPLLTLMQFISSGTGIRVSIDLFMLAVCGGIYMVPLNALLQTLSSSKIRSRVIATNNIINSLFMVLGSIGCIILLSIGVGIAGVFVAMAVANAFVTLYICGLLPMALAKAMARRIVGLFYKVELKGAENLKKIRGRTVVICNHTSFLDAVLLWVNLPDNVFFAINTYIARVWWIKPLINLCNYVTLDPTNPMSVKHIIEEVKRGKKVVIFPEGRITTTGSLMKVYPGPAVIADKTHANILPICIEGSQYSIFAKFADKLKKRPKCKIVMNVLPPQKLNVPEDLKGKKRRIEAAKKLYDMMCFMKFKTYDYNKTLFTSLVEASQLVGKNKIVLEDSARKSLTFRKLLLGIFVLGDQFKLKTKRSEHVGLLLPNSAAAVVTFFGLQVYGRVPCMLNFSSGLKNLITCCKTTEIKTVYTSKMFIKKAKLSETIEAIEAQGIEVIHLEDIGRSLSLRDKLSGFIKSLNPLKHMTAVSPHSPAVVLFTSGSEGTPKGVVLSHINLNANRCQLISVMPLGVLDSIFNAMPIFHSFGLTAGLLVPLLSGLKVFMYPTPLHYRIVPELIYDTDSTVMFGTDTFLNGYAKVAHPYDFHSIRFAIAGAEKVKDETFKTWYDTFGVRIFEGYGATETAPVISVNTPMNFHRGTVGRMLPDMQYKLEKITGVENGKKLLVKGPNIMLGYLLADKPNVLQPLNDEWYDTGDIVSLEEGFISIVGRAKRFAKLGGEMVSLAAVEAAINKIWKDFGNAVISVPDDKKGEQLVLFTTNKVAERSEIIAYYREHGISEISIPKTIRILDTIPLMGSGKTDYVKLSELAS